MDHINFKKHHYSLLFFACIVSFLALSLFWQLGQTETHNNHLEQNVLHGTYSLDGQAPQPIPSDGKLEINGYHHVQFEGHFSQNIPVNQQIILRTDNIRCKFWVNDQLIGSSGQQDTLPEMVKSAGNMWQSFISPGITSDDTIRFEIENVYLDHVKTTYESFLNQIYFGYESTHITNQFYENLFGLAFSVAIVCFGTLAFIAAFLFKKLPVSTERLLLFAGLCLSSGLWGAINFDVQAYLIPAPIFNNSLDIVSLLFTMFFLISYTRSYISVSRNRTVLIIMERVILIGIIITTGLQLFGVIDYYEILPIIQPLAFIISPLVVFYVIYEAKYTQNSEIHELFWSAMILGAGILADAIGNFFDILPYVIWFKVSYVIFILLQFINLTRASRNLLVNQGRMQVLEELAYRDSLTQLGNRTAYIQQKHRIIELALTAKTWDLWVFDLNNLKVVNDTLGHDAGDFLIQQSAEFLKSQFTEKEIYRIGGDEFVVLTPARSLEASASKKAQFIKAIEDIQNTPLREGIVFSLSYGHTQFFPAPNQKFDDAFAIADQKMYKMKAEMRQACVQ